MDDESAYAIPPMYTSNMVFLTCLQHLRVEILPAEVLNEYQKILTLNPVCIDARSPYFGMRYLPEFFSRLNQLFEQQ